MNTSFPPLLMMIRPDDLSGFTGVLAIAGVLCLFSWLICVAAAFCKVKDVQFTVGFLATGTAMLIAFLLTGLCRTFLPEVASSFTPSGLFLIAAVASSLVCSVPLIQYFWNLSYCRGLAIVGGAVGILVASLVMFHLMLHPAETLPARLSIPLFQENQPGLME